MTGEYTFQAPVWRWQGTGAWYFASLPRAISKEIKTGIDRGTAFGSIKVRATTGRTSWNTSIFPDAKRDTYVLPLKAAVRQREQIQEGATHEFTIFVEGA